VNTLLNNSEISYVKVFIWDDLTKIMPLAVFGKYDVN